MRHTALRWIQKRTFPGALLLALFDFLDGHRLMGLELIEKLLEFLQVAQVVGFLRVERWQRRLQ